MSVLAVEDLGLTIGGRPILQDVSFSVAAGETLAIVGESGSGKSLLALSIMDLLPAGSERTGCISLDGETISEADEGRMNAIRGDDLAMVFQEPMTALNPVMTIGDQIAEPLLLHGERSERDARVRAMLDRVGLEGIPSTRYPHELSGGQRQRVVLAAACILEPKVLIADEPTTALDVVAQRRILDLLADLVGELDMALILISHDLAVVAERASRLLVMREGQIIEQGPTRTVLRTPAHPYSAALAAASAHVPDRSEKLVPGRSLLQAHGLTKTYRLPRPGLFRSRPTFAAVDRVDLTIRERESVGLVGASGCGKSTLARLILRLDEADAGRVELDGAADLLSFRRRVQVVFQDPYGSFDPRHRIERIVGEPLHLLPELSRVQRRDRVVQALEDVGIESDALDRYPHQFSGGQRQRIAIARALVVRPDLIIADEPVSALDVSIRAQVLDLFADLQRRLGLATLLITHDLNVVRAVCDTVCVMDAGRIVEQGPMDAIFRRPRHEATRILLEAAPNLERIVSGWSDG